MQSVQARSVKVYLKVFVEFTEDGQMLPRILVWEDGQRFQIDRVNDVRPSYAPKAGGHGDRYTIMVNRQERYLFFEHSTNDNGGNLGRWFLERRE